jgi:hypothetical protein
VKMVTNGVMVIAKVLLKVNITYDVWHWDYFLGNW